MKIAEDGVVIKVSPEVRSMLKDLGKKGDTYDDIIRRLIKVYKGSTDDSNN